MMNGSFEGMAPEDIFAMGIQKGLEMVKNAGRDGDTEIVHVNEEEKEALKGMGGRGSINPATGLREYPPAGADIEGSGRGRDPTGGGGNNDRDGGGDSAMGRSAASRTAETRSISGMESQTGGGTATNPSSAGGTAGPATDERSVGEKLADGLAAAFGGPSFGPPTGADPGFLGAAASLAPGIGTVMGISRGLQAMGVPNREKEPGELGTDEYSGQRDGDILSPAKRQQQQQQPNQTPQFAWQRPGSQPTAPQGLGFDAGMTPLQQRTAIATGGTNANAGIYRDPAIIDFYRQLATYDLTDPGGAPRPGAAPTDIESQFLTQLGGQPGNDVQSFLKALAGL